MAKMWTLTAEMSGPVPVNGTGIRFRRETDDQPPVEQVLAMVQMLCLRAP